MSVQSGEVMTVTGPVDQKQIGLTLPHEHIMVDFIGAEESGPHRYVKEEVVATMLPLLEEVRALDVSTFVDCTPMFLARDVDVLKALSEQSGLQILTNTGQYKEPFLPKRTFEVSAEELAQSWVEEWENGIDGTDVRPGFIKTAVNPEPLAPTQIKVIRAAALTSRDSSLPIATHCGKGDQASEILDILDAEEVEPERWIFVHAQNEEDVEKTVSIARRGAWVELDGIGENTVEKHMRPLLALLEAGFQDQNLLSHDAGWYRVGEEPGGEKKSFTFLLTDFLPLCLERGISQQTINRITRENPGKAYRIR
jgi:phosphotriesterase-related protein